MLGSISSPDEIVGNSSKAPFDFIKCSRENIGELQSMSGNADEENSGAQLDIIKSNGVSFIADNVEDATILTGIISSGTEYAMGCFIGEPTPQLDDGTNI